MNANNPPELDRDELMWNVAQAIENSVRAIRKALGKRNPEDCIPHTPEREEVLSEFLGDVIAAMGGEDG